MPQCTLRVLLDRSEPVFVGGEHVTGQVEVHVDETVQCNGLTVRAMWRTSGEGNTDSGEGPVATLAAATWRAGESLRFPFDLTLPNGPFTYQGNLIQLAWSVEARADVPWAIDPKGVAPLTLVPGPGQPVTNDPAMGTMSPADFGKYTGLHTLVCGIGLAMVLFGLGVAIVPFLYGNDFGAGIPCGTFAFFIGIIAFGFTIRRVLAERRLGPVTLTVEPANLRPGQSARCRVRFRPPGELELEGASATVIAQESATRGSGKNSSTRTHVLLTKEISLHAPRRVRAREEVELTAEITLPPEAPFSFHSFSNRIIWQVNVAIRIPGWPDWVHYHPLVVQP